MTDFIAHKQGRCAVCGHRTLAVDTRPDGTDLIACFSCSRDGLKGTAYLRALAAALGASVQSLLRGPEFYPALELRQPENSRDTVEGQRRLDAGEEGAEAMPSPWLVLGWSARLLSSAALGAYEHMLWRQVSPDVARDVGLGYGTKGGRPCFVFPCWARRPLGGDAELIGVKLRFWPNPIRDGGRPFNWPGRPASLFPWVPSPASTWDGPILICEGEWDCLAARSQGIEAYTSTAGQHWPEAWDNMLPTGRDVIVAYDAGEDGESLPSARQLAERIEGQVWEWPHGTRKGYDICDFIRDGGDIWERWSP